MFHCHFDFVERRLTFFFEWYARIVCRNAFYFITVPVLLTGLVCIRMFTGPVDILMDNIHLYTPSDGRAAENRDRLKQLFPVPESDLTYWKRRVDYDHAGYLVVTPKRVDNTSEEVKPNVWDLSTFREVNKLWRLLGEIPIYQDGTMYTYGGGRFGPHLCVDIEKATCMQNPMLNPKVASRSEYLIGLASYPVTTLYGENNRVSGHLFIGNLVGAPDLAYKNYTESDFVGFQYELPPPPYVMGAEALLLPYALRHDSKHYISLAVTWQEKLSKLLKDFKGERIEVTWWTFETLREETERDRMNIVKMMPPLFLVIAIFTVICGLTENVLSSKPFAALAGVCSAFMGIVAATEILQIFGISMTSVVVFMPFVVFSIGVDDIFIILAAWRRTDNNSSVETRMVETLRDAGVSITVTSLTDALSFAIGCISTFPAIWIFCAYASLAVTLVYLFQMSLFIAIMSLDGHREHKRLNAFTFQPIDQFKKQDDVIENSFLDGHHPEPNSLKTDPLSLSHKSKKFKKAKTKLEKWLAQFDPNYHQPDTLVSKFFGGPYSVFLSQPQTKIAVFALFLIYWTTAGYGCSKIVIGLGPEEVLPVDSYASTYLAEMEKYFSTYGDFIHIWFEGLSSGGDGFTKSRLNDTINILNKFTFTNFTYELQEPWTESFPFYLDYVETLVRNETVVGDLSNELKSFLNFTTFVSSDRVETTKPFENYKYDMVFDGPNSGISAARFLVRSRNFGYPNHTEAMHLLRDMADELSGSAWPELKVGVYHYFFDFAQQDDAIVPGLLLNVGIAALCVILVSLILIPKPICAFWVCCTLLSINFGIVGYMAFWNVKLSFASMITIVMSIGFTVDFSAHVAYHFSKDKNISPAERIREAMKSMGSPVMQSGVSSILGVLLLLAVPNYVAISFVKTIFLAISLGVLHGLVFLPVVLSMFASRGWDSKPNISSPNSIPPPTVPYLNEPESLVEKEYPVSAETSRSNSLTSLSYPIPYFCPQQASNVDNDSNCDIELPEQEPVVQVHRSGSFSEGVRRRRSNSSDLSIDHSD